MKTGVKKRDSKNYLFIINANIFNKYMSSQVDLVGGEGEIRTRARCYTTNPLAGDPLGPLGYFSNPLLSLPEN